MFSFSWKTFLLEICQADGDCSKGGDVCTPLFAEDERSFCVEPCMSISKETFCFSNWPFTNYNHELKLVLKQSLQRGSPARETVWSLRVLNLSGKGVLAQDPDKPDDMDSCSCGTRHFISQCDPNSIQCGGLPCEEGQTTSMAEIVIEDAECLGKSNVVVEV